MTSADLVRAFLSGAPTPRRPVLPIYLCLYRAPAERALLREAYRQRIGAGRWAVVDFDAHIDARLQARLQADALVAEEPDWLDVGFSEGRVTCEGAEALVEDDRLLWRPAGALETADLCAERPAVGLWRTGLDPMDFVAIDAATPTPDPEQLLASGSLELARRLIAGDGGRRFVVSGPMAAPFWSLHSLFGFESMMELVARDDYVAIRYAMERILARAYAHVKALAAIGVEAVFIEECLASSDVISTEAFQRYALPYAYRMVGIARACRLKAVYYYCGGIEGRLSHLNGLRADALAFEESKKAFKTDIGRIRGELGPKTPLLGNVDVTLVRDGDAEAIRRELARQEAAAGAGPLAHSIGSPLTLDTPPAHAGLFLRLAKETRKEE